MTQANSKIGVLVFNISLIMGTAYSAVAAGSPGPLDRKIPSGEGLVLHQRSNLKALLNLSLRVVLNFLRYFV